jgi:branched-chain amino acid transport system substrate-binding protein
MLASEKIYADCGLPVLTPMASNPAITEQGLANVFRLTNRDDRKGPALARWLMTTMGKKTAVVVDDGTPYGKGVADQFASGFAAAGGAVIRRWTAKQGQTDFSVEVSPRYRRISTCCSSAGLKKARTFSRTCARRA